MVCRKSSAPSFDARHAGLVAGLLQLARLGLVAVLAAPGDAEGRIAEHAVEAPFGFRPLVARLLAVRVVRDERVAEVDFGLPVVLDEEVGLADGVVGRGEFLAVDGDEFLDALPFRRCGGAVEQVFLATDNMPPVPQAGS